MQGPLEEDFHKIFSQGPVRDHARTYRGFHQDLFSRAHKDLNMLKPLTAFHPDPHKTFSQGLATDLDQDLPQDRHKRSCCCRSGLTRSRGPPKSLPQALIQAHLWDMASARSSCKDLLEKISPGSSTRPSVKDPYRIMQGPLREEFSRISTRARLC